MSFLRNSIAPFCSALVVCLYAWLYGGMRGSVLVPVMPWVWALLVEVMLCFPQQHGGESTGQARLRVFKAMKKDPMVWVTLGFLGMLLVPFLNCGLCPSCDAARIRDGVSAAPTFSFLPYCVNRLHHLTVFMWFLPILTTTVAVKHSLTKWGKRAFLWLIVWNAALLAVLGFVQQVAGAPGPLWWTGGWRVVKPFFFSTFGYPNAGGAFFTACFCLGVALWRWDIDEVNHERKAHPQSSRNISNYTFFWRKHFIGVPTLLVFFAALNTLSRAAIMLVSAAAGVLVIHAAVCTLAQLKKAQRVRASAAMLFALIGLAFIVSVFTPRKIRREMSSIGTVDVLNRVTNRGEYHSRVALDLFWEHPFFGCGGWGYVHMSPTKMTEAERKGISYAWSSGGANVHNDYLQFLVEHGAAGFACLAAIVALLLLPTVKTWSLLVNTVKFSKSEHKGPPRPITIFALPSAAFAVLVAALCILVHAFGDCPMRSPAVLSVFFTSLAAVDGFMPSVRKDSDDEEEEDNSKRN